MNKKSFDEVITAIQAVQFQEEYDLVVAIGRGGVVPGYLLSRLLGIPLQILSIQFRDEQNQPFEDGPKLLQKVPLGLEGKKVLLVDDRVKTGTTFAFAKDLLPNSAVIKTFAVNGRADYSVFDEACFVFPWNVIPAGTASVQ